MARQVTYLMDRQNTQHMARQVTYHMDRQDTHHMACQHENRNQLSIAISRMAFMQEKYREGRGLKKYEGEWIEKIENRKKKSLAVGEACRAIF